MESLLFFDRERVLVNAYCKMNGVCYNIDIQIILFNFKRYFRIAVGLGHSLENYQGMQ